ncbi:4067_t:CDS:1, partial [Acaulospora colombiana]
MSDQFSNAPEDDTAPDAPALSASTTPNPSQPQPNLRDPSGNQKYIDDPDLAWSEEEEEDDYES